MKTKKHNHTKPRRKRKDRVLARTIASQKAIPARMFKDISGLWDAVDRAAATGIVLTGSRRGANWVVSFEWRHEKVGYYSHSGTLVVAGQLLRAQTIGEAMATLLRMLQLEPRAAASGDQHEKACGTDAEPPTDTDSTSAASMNEGKVEPRRQAG